MKSPLHITFRRVPRSEDIRTEIEAEAAELETYYEGIIACHVLLELAHRHRQKGNRYHVRITLTVPGEEIVVSHEPTQHDSLQDFDEGTEHKADEVEAEHRYLRPAIGNAFDTARRRLQDYARRQRGAVKQHMPPLHGRVTALFSDAGYGFITASDGDQVYFHRNAVTDGDFARLTVGAEIVFAEERGEEGPQASTVRLLGQHHYVEPMKQSRT